MKKYLEIAKRGMKVVGLNENYVHLINEPDNDDYNGCVAFGEEWDYVITTCEFFASTETLEGKIKEKVKGFMVEKAIHYAGNYNQPPEVDIVKMIEHRNFSKVLEAVIKDMQKEQLHNFMEEAFYMEDEINDEVDMI